VRLNNMIIILICILYYLLSFDYVL
jgi:hypothetical protein